MDEGVSKKNLRVNFLGFVGNKINNTGEDRGYLIDTAQDLWDKYSQDGKGKNYTIAISNKKTRVATIYVEIEEPKANLSEFNENSKTKNQNNQIEALLKKAYVYNQAGNFTSATRCYDKILSLHSEQYEALLNRGITRQKMGNEEGAEKDLLAAQQIHPDDPVLLNALGVLYLNSGHEKKAETFLLKAGDATSRINLALYYWKKGKRAKVVSSLKEAERKDSQNPYAPYYLGLFYRQTGEYTAAHDQFEKAISVARKRGRTDLIHQIESLPPRF